MTITAKKARLYKTAYDRKTGQYVGVSLHALPNRENPLLIGEPVLENGEFLFDITDGSGKNIGLRKYSELQDFVL